MVKLEIYCYWQVNDSDMEFDDHDIEKFDTLEEAHDRVDQIIASRDYGVVGQWLQIAIDGRIIYEGDVK